MDFDCDGWYTNVYLSVNRWVGFRLSSWIQSCSLSYDTWWHRTNFDGNEQYVNWDLATVAIGWQGLNHPSYWVVALVTTLDTKWIMMMTVLCGTFGTAIGWLWHTSCHTGPIVAAAHESMCHICSVVVVDLVPQSAHCGTPASWARLRQRHPSPRATFVQL